MMCCTVQTREVQWSYMHAANYVMEWTDIEIIVYFLEYMHSPPPPNTHNTAHVYTKEKSSMQ